MGEGGADCQEAGQTAGLPVQGGGHNSVWDGSPGATARASKAPTPAAQAAAPADEQSVGGPEYARSG
jgi:hypothetical protein